MLSNTQQRLERSIFEAIRKVCVQEGYLPDIADTTKYPEPFNTDTQLSWETDLKLIKEQKGFAVEVFSNSQSKGVKAVPRIVIIPRRTMPGEVGSPMDGFITQDPNDPNKFARMSIPFEASTFNFDIHLVSSSAAQDRVLNAILSRAIGIKKFIPYYDDLTDLFLMRLTNSFDYPDPADGLDERAFSYEVPDVFDVDGSFTSISKIDEITVEIETVKPGDSLEQPTEPTEMSKVIVNSSTTKYE